MPEKTSTTKTTKTKSTATKSTASKSTASTKSTTSTKSTKSTASSASKSSTAKKSAPFQGEFTPAVGRRKKSVAQVRLYPKGSGMISVNGKEAEEYFDEDRVSVIHQPLKLTSHQKDMDFSIVVKGGGPQGQAEAIRLGISRALIKNDPDLTASLKAKGLTTRDPRRKERKKPGLKKARRSPQWSKR